MAAILKYFLICKSICLLLLPLTALCQQEKPKMNRDFSLAALRIGLSVTDPIQPLLYEGMEAAYSLQADLSIDRFMLVGDIGTARYTRTKQPEDTLALPYQYDTEGNYFKIGVDINFLKDMEANTRFAKDDVVFWGLRFAHSTFSANATFDIADPIWGDFDVVENNDKLNAWWIEMVAGIKVEIFKNVFLGYTMQYRVLKTISQKNGETLTPYDVPGFGSTNSKNNFGFDYYLFYRIPFK